MIEDLYWTALSRPPTKSEEARAVSLLEASSEKERRFVLEDLAWALLNSKEFVLRQ